MLEPVSPMTAVYPRGSLLEIKEKQFERLSRLCAVVGTPLAIVGLLSITVFNFWIDADTTREHLRWLMYVTFIIPYIVNCGLAIRYHDLRKELRKLRESQRNTPPMHLQHSDE